MLLRREIVGNAVLNFLHTVALDHILPNLPMKDRRLYIRMIQIVQLREPNVFVVVSKRKISHCVSYRVIGMFLDVKGSIRQRMRLGIVNIMYRRVNTTDGAVENRLITVHDPSFVTQE